MVAKGLARRLRLSDRIWSAVYQALKDFAGPVATVIAAIAAVSVTGYFAWRQKNLAREKLRLDLLDRRLEIFSSVSDFYEVLLSWQGTPEPEQILARTRFFGAIQRGKFLFKRASGIDVILDDLYNQGVKVMLFKQNTEDLKVDHESFMKLFNKTQDIYLRKFPSTLVQLKSVISEYVSFHDL